MQILIGIILVLLFPFLIAIVAGAWASYWVVLGACTIAYGAFLAFRLSARRYRDMAGDIQSASVESSRSDIQESTICSSSCISSEGKPDSSDADRSPPKIVRRLTACGACGNSIERYSIYCPKCGKDPRVKS